MREIQNIPHKILKKFKMVKLQKTIRGNGSILWSVNLPLDIISQMGWERGDKLDVTKNFDLIIISKTKKEDSNDNE